MLGFSCTRGLDHASECGHRPDSTDLSRYSTKGLINPLSIMKPESRVRHDRSDANTSTYSGTIIYKETMPNGHAETNGHVKVNGHVNGKVNGYGKEH